MKLEVKLACLQSIEICPKKHTALDALKHVEGVGLYCCGFPEVSIPAGGQKTLASLIVEGTIHVAVADMRPV